LNANEPAPSSPHERSIFVLFNPAAGRGRGAQRVETYLGLLRRYLPGFEHASTRQAGDEVALVDRALERGYKSIVAVGGDGTWSIVADRIVRSGRTDVTLGLLPAGTGNDFGKSLGISFRRAEEVVRAIAARRRRKIDVGRVEGRHFLNVVGFGFDIAVIDDAASLPILKGDALYKFCALRQLLRFPGITLEVADDNGHVERREHLMLIVANANFFGGSFHIAPHASLADGRLDLVSIHNVGPLKRAQLFAKVAKGKHESERRVTMRQSPRFRIGFEAQVRYEVDGEICTSRSNAVEIESVPKALHVFTPQT
jgi:diacylglycerol kinase (ATP)